MIYLALYNNSMTIGIDEVGRGCWAGPLVAAAVGLIEDHGIIGLDDSKKIQAKKRLQLAQEIKQSTDQIGIGWVWPSEINKIGLTKSVQLAMLRAVAGVSYTDSPIIIDGNINYLQSIICDDRSCSKLALCELCSRINTVIGGDGTVPSVSAASIIAKVARDTYMQDIAKKYPNYHFESHVGYGTRLHVEALERYGVTTLHRLEYKPIKRFISEHNLGGDNIDVV